MESALPPVFDEILESAANPLVEAAVAEGRAAIGYSCSYVPEALLSVDGLFPVRLRAPGVAGTPMADTYLSSVVCSYPRSLLECALEERYSFLSGWVFTASCDHLRRLYDNLAYLLRPAFNYMVDLPHKTGDAALSWYVDELGLLAEALGAHFGVDTGSTPLSHAIARLNEQLGVLRRIGTLRRRAHPPISGSDFHRLVAAGTAAPRDKLGEVVLAIERSLAGHDGLDSHRARLMVVGSQLDDPGYLEVIESTGGLVVADRFCFGSLPGLEPIAESGDPLPALAEHALRKTRCPRMMGDFDVRLRDVKETVRDFAVDGVVIETMKFCDIWGYEAAALAGALRDAGIPVLRVEREYARGGKGQLRTRVQAFLESMGK
jgi:benzoyl-CoA reductase/2-hydroxyglutaryl-CoA dehydratase subunit BcrC/BadD/HgdB